MNFGATGPEDTGENAGSVTSCRARIVTVATDVFPIAFLAATGTTFSPSTIGTVTVAANVARKAYGRATVVASGVRVTGNS